MPAGRRLIPKQRIITLSLLASLPLSSLTSRSDARMLNRFCWFLIELFLLTREKHAAAVTHAGVTMATKDFWPLSDTDELVALLFHLPL